MVSLLDLSQRRMPAFIAVLAILMLFIAPEVSKSLAQWRAANVAMAHSEQADSAPEDAMTESSMSADDGSMSMHHMADHPTLQPATDGMATMDDLACGYCDLLVHFPFMIWVLIPLTWLLCTATRAPPIRLIVSFYATFLPGSCLPRAPPAR